MNPPISPTYKKMDPRTSETKLYITIDSRTPIMTKVSIPPGYLTLGQFKTTTSLSDSSYKFYFKSHDSEFGLVKEELVDDTSIVPVDGDKVVAWVISNNAAQSSLFEDPTDRSSKRFKETMPSHLNGTEHPSSILREEALHHYDQMQHESTCIFVNLVLDNYNSLGLTVVCPGDSLGVFVDTIQPNSVAERDGRLRRGDRIVEINGIDLNGLKVDEAIGIFKQCIARKGAINLVLQRNTQATFRNNHTNPQYNQGTNTSPYPQPNSGFNPAVDLPLPVIDQGPRRELPEPPEPPVRNISLPRSLTPRSLYTTSNLENLNSSNDLRLQLDSRSVYEPTTPTSARQIDVALHCGKDNIRVIYQALSNDSRSLEIKDREWLKVVVKNAFLGSTLVKWLSRNVYGFCNRSEVKRYANQMLNLGLIKSPMSSASFSEKCYYTLS